MNQTLLYIAIAYVVGVIGIHRLILRHRIGRAQNQGTLAKIDWHFLVEQLESVESEHHEKLLAAFTSNDQKELAHFENKYQSDYFVLLKDLVRDPSTTLRKLEESTAKTAQEVYLWSHLTLDLSVTLFNREWLSFRVKYRLNQAIERFGNIPALYFSRARASSLIALHASMVDDLGRAVYFSNNGEFYLSAVTQWPFVAQFRPALDKACRDAMQ
jgi:hypothetical protein